MKTKISEFNWDFLGITTSLLCAVHCALLPVIATLSAMSSSWFMDDHIFELIMISAAFFVAALSLINSYFKIHKSVTPFISFMIGATLILMGFLWVSEEASHLINALGGIFIALAHWINWKKLKAQPCKISAQL